MQGDEDMSANETPNNSTTELPPGKSAAPRKRISLDTWAVLFALAAALLIRTGLLKHIPW
jgi:hypothetical protein